MIVRNVDIELRSPNSTIENHDRCMITIEVPDDEVNSNICMGTFTWLLHHMSDLGFIKDVHTDPNIPLWMRVFYEPFNEIGPHDDIKYFISNLILNCHQVFQPYASFWIPKLIELITNTQLSINIFVVSIVTLIIQWSKDISVASNISKTEINNLVKFIALHCYDDNIAITRVNLELYQVLLNKWSDQIDVPYKSIFDKLQNLDMVNRNSCGIQMLAISLNNKIQFMIGASDETKLGFIKHIGQNLKHKMKNVYKPAFELCGLILKQILDEQISIHSWIEELKKENKTSLDFILKRNVSEYLDCLALITKSCPSFIWPQISILKSLKENDLCKALEIFGSSSNVTEEWILLYKQLDNLDIFKNMEFKSSSTICALIQIIRHIIFHISDWNSNSELKLLILKSFDYCLPCCRHEEKDIRAVFYQLFMDIASLEKDFIERGSLRSALLMGLVDSNQEISQSIRNFCSSSSSLPKEALNRAHNILEILFVTSPKATEFLNRSKFLAISTNILLEITSHSPDFIKPLFQDKLDNRAVFETLTANQINSQTSRSLLPGFVKPTTDMINISSVSHDKLFKIPTSQNIPKKTTNFDWIKLASTLHFPEQESSEPDPGLNYSMQWPSSQIPGIELSFSLQTQTSFLLPLDSERKNSTEVKETDKNDDKRIYNRFIQATQQPEIAPEQKADFFRYRAVEKERVQEKSSSIKKNLKKSSVFLYRNYHTGKIPDIQIQNCSIIAPLQKLAQLDENFSKDLFRHLYNSLITEGSSVVEPNNFKVYCFKLTKCFDDMLDTCNINDKNLIASCLQVAIDNSSLISMSPALIYKASCLTGNHVLATILLEKYLIFHTDTDTDSLLMKEEPPLKRIKICETSSVKTIIPCLMKLYRILDLNEEIIGLLHMEELSADTNFSSFRKALEADCTGDYTNSFKLYNAILGQESTIRNNDNGLEHELLTVSQDGLIHCLEKLCKWSDLSNFLDSIIMNDSSQPVNHTVIKSLIHSKLRMSVPDYSNKSSITDLEKLISQSQQKLPNCELLIPMEMGLYYIVKEDYHKAQDFCDIGYNNILDKFHDCSSMKTDIHMLQSLQLLYEMSEFLQIVKNNETDLRIIDKWNLRRSDPERDSVEFCEKLLFHRTCYMNLFKIRYPTLINKIEDHLFDLKLQFIDTCICQNRTTPALNYLQLCRDASYQRSKNSKVSWILRYTDVWLRSSNSHGHFLHAENVKEVPTGIIKSISLLTTLSNIDDVSFENKWKYFLNIGDCYWSLANILKLNCSSLNDPKIFASVLKITNLKDNPSPEALIADLYSKAFRFLEEVVPIYLDSDKDQQNLSKSLMILSDFCDSQIVAYESDSNESCVLSEIIQNYVKSTLYSMKMGQFSAKIKFPRVLQIVVQHCYPTSSSGGFFDLFSSIPCWMFIPWLDQMIPYLFSDKYLLVESIISRIADEYPHALFYPFNLQILDVVDLSPAASKIQHQLSSLNLVHQFTMALCQMIQPEYQLQSWLEEASIMFNNESGRESIVLKFRDLFRNVFTNPDSSSISCSHIRKSQFQQEFCNQFRPLIIDHFNEDGRNMYHMSLGQFNNILGKIRNKLVQWNGTNATVRNLNHFSPWLAKYNIRDNVQNFRKVCETNSNWLEVPGQYSNITTRPFPEKHVKIFKFDPNIQIIPSKQSPKKIKIIGDNEQCYHFLVKSGEDLRQDQRIEQMFNVINDILSRDYKLMKCLRPSTFLVTYNVIPISKKIGLLEWIENTVTLNKFYRKTITSKEIELLSNIEKQYYARFSTKLSFTESWLKEDFNETTSIFKSHENTISKLDLLRRSFVVISKNYESFFQLRIKFIQQYAVIAAAHYILGIGDRHLENFLIDESNGNIVGIDFGYSFGIGTILLPIPELVPFRLTSTIVRFLRPAGVGGIFTQTLDNVLAALSDNQSTIMSVMHVFLTNPILDWARMSTISKQPLESFTPKRIDICNRKLKRENPLKLLLNELELKHSDSKWLLSWKERQSILECTSPTNMLVHMATNSEYLARAWRGFQPLL